MERRKELLDVIDAHNKKFKDGMERYSQIWVDRDYVNRDRHKTARERKSTKKTRTNLK